MGPFELMDLVGVDVGLDVSRSFYEQSFGEPRWRPSPITVRTVAAGRHGRKSGRGYYDYARTASTARRTPSRRRAGGGDGLVVIAGDTAARRTSCAAPRATPAGTSRCPEDALERRGAGADPRPRACSGEDPEAPLQGAPQAICCAAGSLGALDPGGAAVGFHALPPFEEAAPRRADARAETRAPSAADAAEHFFATLGKHTRWVGDAPGLVLGRIVCQVVNEAAFALGEGVGSAEDIDAGMVHGLNYPRGHSALGRRDRPRSRARGAAGALRRAARGALPPGAGADAAWSSSGRLGRQTGAGFFDYDE